MNLDPAAENRTGGPFRPRRIFSVAGVVTYWALLNHYRVLQPKHFAVGALVLMLMWGGAKHERWRDLFLPLLLTGMVYDSQRLYSDFLRGPVHITEPYFFDLKLFGIQSNGTLLTPSEWWQLHLHPALDFLCGFAYIFFIPEFFMVAAYYFFFFEKRESDLAKKMTWDFFWLNILGYSTYYWYAAAPPWYAAAHGFAQADLTTPASLAGCARFDQIIGLPVFKTFYGQSADVFGAIPSLHVAYPFLAAIYSFRVGRLRAWSIIFYFWMSFSAVYLNHHYVIDVIWGTAYALIVAWAPAHLGIAKIPGVLPGRGTQRG